MKYNDQVPPPALFPYPPTNKARVWNAEPQLQVGTYSQQFHVPANLVGSDSRGIRVELNFSSAPGTFKIRVLETDTDSGSAAYVDPPTAVSVSAVNAPSATKAVIEIANFLGSFGVLYVETALQNNVTTTADVSRT